MRFISTEVFVAVVAHMGEQDIILLLVEPRLDILQEAYLEESIVLGNIAEHVHSAHLDYRLVSAEGGYEHQPDFPVGPYLEVEGRCLDLDPSLGDPSDVLKVIQCLHSALSSPLARTSA